MEALYGLVKTNMQIRLNCFDCGDDLSRKCNNPVFNNILDTNLASIQNLQNVL